MAALSFWALDTLNIDPMIAHSPKSGSMTESKKLWNKNMRDAWKYEGDFIIDKSSKISKHYENLTRSSQEQPNNLDDKKYCHLNLLLWHWLQFIISISVNLSVNLFTLFAQLKLFSYCLVRKFLRNTIANRFMSRMCCSTQAERWNTSKRSIYGFWNICSLTRVF